MKIVFTVLNSVCNRLLKNVKMLDTERNENMKKGVDMKEIRDKV